jgi:hypothetical protein
VVDEPRGSLLTKNIISKAVMTRLKKQTQEPEQLEI